MRETRTLATIDAHANVHDTALPGTTLPEKTGRATTASATTGLEATGLEATGLEANVLETNELRTSAQPRCAAALLAPTAAATAHDAPRPRARRAWPIALKLIRRVHLYLGIALLPWVLLYGATALLFNHADWMSDDRAIELRAAELRDAALEQLPSADAFAADVVARLSRRSGALELVPGSVLWLGGVSLNAKADGADARFGIDPALRSARLVVDARAPLAPAPAWASPAKLDDWTPLSKEARASFVDAASALARAHGVGLDSVQVRKLPELRLRVRDGAREYVCDATLDGGVKVQAAERVSAWRDRLLRLHLQHGDPGYPGARAIWALFVDAMGIAMIAWALSGVVMWWTIRPTRAAGLLALGVGIAAMALLALALWRGTGMA